MCGVGKVSNGDKQGPSTSGKYGASWVDGRAVGVDECVLDALVVLFLFIWVVAERSTLRVALEQGVLLWDLISVVVKGGIAVAYAAVHHTVVLHVVFEVSHTEFHATVRIFGYFVNGVFNVP